MFFRKSESFKIIKKKNLYENHAYFSYISYLLSLNLLFTIAYMVLTYDVYVSFRAVARLGVLGWANAIIFLKSGGETSKKLGFWYSFAYFFHGTIMQTVITCKKILAICGTQIAGGVLLKKSNILMFC